MTTVTFNRDDLASAVREVAGAVVRGPFPILHCIIIKTGSETEFLAANEVFQVSRKIMSEECSGAITTAVSAERLNAILQSFPSGATVRLDIQDGHVALSCGRARLRLRAEPWVEFPEMATPNGDAATMRANDLFAAFQRVLHAADEAGPVAEWKRGLLLRTDDAGIVVGCSSSGLARQSFKAEGKCCAVVPIPTATFLAKSGGALAFVRAGERTFSVSVDGTFLLTSRVIQAQYPEFERIIPGDAAHVALVDPKLLVEAMVRATIVNDDKSRMMTLDFGKDVITLKSSASFGAGEEEIPCDYSVEPLTIGIRADQMRAALSALSADTLRIGMVDKDTAISLTAVGRDDTLMLVMPMQL